ncbi:MAG: copper amine oxidase N-terminal domain-containing protein [Defluviitaleaceae bacterium]|nr:copper amine oxidase N-terminal domain-containing protein [Defluviitaleaceae bacterium]
MSKNKKIIAIVCMLVLTMTAIPFFAAYANRQTSITVNGQMVLFTDQQPIMESNRVLVPVRGVFEHMGFEVTWDSATRVARLESDDIVVIIPAGTTSFFVMPAGSGAESSQIRTIVPDVPQRMVNNRMLLPLRAVAEAVGATAQWNNANRVAQIVNTATPPHTPTPAPTPPPPARVDIQYLLGEGRNLESFDNQRFLFGYEIGQAYFGPHERIYTFVNGLAVDIVFTVRGISGIRVDYVQAANITAFHFNGIDGTSTYRDVLEILGNDIYNVLYGDYSPGGSWAYEYRIGYYRSLLIDFNADGYVLGISFFIRSDALLF